MKPTIKHALALLLLFGSAWGCDWGIRTGVDEDADATDTPGDRIDTVETPPDTDGDDLDVTPDPDVTPDLDAGDPDGTDPDLTEDPDVTPDAEVPDEPPDVVDVIEEEAVPSCGNGIVESGEECDDASGFCVDCSLVVPSGWIECTDSAGNTAFLFIVTIPGNRPWADFRDRCASDIEAYSPEDFEFYGLAVFSDEEIWDCIEPSLNDLTNYYIGLTQDTTAGDYSEPDGGWYWTGYNGTDWVSVAPFDPDNGFLDGSFDNGGGGGSVECGRIASFMGIWSFSDYSCTAATGWDGVCMIQF